MPKCLYLVSEPATLRKGSGAYRHIEVGRQYLAAHFDLDFYPLCGLPDERAGDFQVGASSLPRKEVYWRRWLKKTGLWHSLKDLKILLDHHRGIYRHYRAIKMLAPDFIYERSNFLHFQGLLISKWLGIPHVYECNGIKYLEHQERVFSWFNWLWKRLERWAYQQSDFVFFVGLWGDKLKLSTDNWMNIENGVEQSFLDHFRDHQKDLDGKINLCFIGSLMPHHGFEVLIEALSRIDTGLLHLHLIGNKLEGAVQELRSTLETTCHGFLDREQLADVLEEMHIGVIPGGKDYPSFMKLFDYGAARCLVLAPDLKNLQYWFAEKELHFFEKGSAVALAAGLNEVIAMPELISRKGDLLYQRIQTDYTWARIFEKKTSKIKGIVENRLSVRNSIVS